ncbi:PucR family transcriptional regulator [Glutamicibacter sp. MNS18]|uniref:PucR family transcriptional regulator n=1 Tax=Glutamicibacter sp. MNS18 TaxID=2989817 RepID=UPI0022361AA4|nr:PucR family transcriptional regulator [Glutamicibacter sp. MNS18]MCW4466470.1 PucR family transcriptional regulator [Glutamicibacter sp. MNS18]
MITLLQLGAELGRSFHATAAAGFPAVPVSGVHISELEDPTPYLEGSELLLTTGMPFASSAAATVAYLSRLAAHGITALGLGLGPWLETVPDYVIDESQRLGIHLGVVPDSVPFQHVSRAYWRLSAHSATSELMGTLGTQTALARAANRPDADTAVIERLARALGGWSAYLPLGGQPDAYWPPSTAALLPRIRRECERFHGVDMPSAATFELQGQPVVAYPVLAGHRLDGFLAICAGGQVTKADRQVMMTVATLLSLRARQRQAEGATTRALGAAVTKLLLHGEHHAARLVARDLGMSSTLDRPVRVLLAASADTTAIPPGLPELIGSIGDSPSGTGLPDYTLAYAHEGIWYLVLEARSAGPAERSGTAHGTSGDCHLRAVLSEPLQLPEIPGQLPALRRMLAQATPGILAPADPGTGQRASGWVRTLRDYRRSDLLSTVRAYLAARGTWEEAARSLGIHRNSLRLRIATASELLQVDLDDPDVAAELWLAIRQAES